MSWKLLPWWPGQGACGFGPQWFLLLPLPSTFQGQNHSELAYPAALGAGRSLCLTQFPQHTGSLRSLSSSAAVGDPEFMTASGQNSQCYTKVYLKTNISCVASCVCRLKIHDNARRRHTLKQQEIFITLFGKHQTPLCLNLTAHPPGPGVRVGWGGRSIF